MAIKVRDGAAPPPTPSLRPAIRMNARTCVAGKITVADLGVGLLPPTGHNFGPTLMCGIWVQPAAVSAEQGPTRLLEGGTWRLALWRMCWNFHVSEVNLLEPKAHLFRTTVCGHGTVSDAQERHNICFKPSPAETGLGLGICQILHLGVVTVVTLKCVLASAWTDLKFTHGQITAGRTLQMLTGVSIALRWRAGSMW